MIKKVELNYKCWQNWFLDPFFHVGNLKLLGKCNGLLTCAVDIILMPLIILTIMCDYVVALSKKFNFIINYHKWLGGPWSTWPTLLSWPWYQLQQPYKSCRTCLTNHVGFISWHNMPLVNNSLGGRHTHANLQGNFMKPSVHRLAWRTPGL